MPKDTLRVVARIIARPERVDDLRALLIELIEPTRKEAGCITYELLQNKSDPTDFTFVEEWENDDALNAHAASEHIKDVVSRWTGLINGAPDIRKYFLAR